MCQTASISPNSPIPIIMSRCPSNCCMQALVHIPNGRGDDGGGRGGGGHARAARGDGELPGREDHRGEGGERGGRSSQG